MSVKRVMDEIFMKLSETNQSVKFKGKVATNLEVEIYEGEKLSVSMYCRDWGEAFEFLKSMTGVK